jgi:hypothetical protein
MEKPMKTPAASVATEGLPDSAEAQHAMQNSRKRRGDTTGPPELGKNA